MLNHLKKTFKHTIIYGLGGVASKAVGFLLIPVYTSHLNPVEYGVVALVLVYTTILEIVLKFGVGPALFRVYFSEKDEDKRGALITTSFTFQVGASIIVFAILFPLSSQLSSLLFGSESYTIFFQYATATQLFMMLRNIPLAVLRAKERPGLYSVVTFSRFILMMGLNILFIVVLREGPLGIIKAQFYAGIILAPVLIGISIRHMKFRFSWDMLKRVMLFGLPLIPEGLAGWILSLSDRYILRLIAPTSRFVEVAQKGLGELQTKVATAFAGSTATLHEVGLYNLANRFGLIIKIGLVTPFIMAWGPLMFAVYGKPEAKSVYRAVLTLFTLISVGVALAVGLMAPDITHLMATWAYYPSWLAVFMLSMSSVFYGMYLVFTVGTSVVGKTKYQAFTAAIGAAMNIALNLLLIPRWGMIGASVATVISYGVMAFVHYHFAQRQYRIDYDLGYVFKVVGLSFIFWLGSLLLPFGWSWLPVRLGLLGLFVVSLKLFGLFKTDEVKLVLDGIKGRFSKKQPEAIPE